jgi:hypothetical protein
VVGIPVPRLGMLIAGSVGCCVLGMADGSRFGVVHVGCSYVVAALPTKFI